jgi:hypothetical protein
LRSVDVIREEDKTGKGVTRDHNLLITASVMKGKMMMAEGKRHGVP